MKLGKLDPRPHKNTLLLAKYLHTLPAPVRKAYHEYMTPVAAKQMYGNDLYGCCAWAMWANFIILKSVHAGKIIIPTLDDVLNAYAACTGFNRTTGANDNGTAMTESFEYMRTVGMAGFKIRGWAQIDHTNREHRMLGVQLFGATLTGIQCPTSAQIQFASKQSWEWVPNSPIAGGHAVMRPGAGRRGDNYVSWAKWDQKASLEWSTRVVDEEYVAITDYDNTSPELEADLNQL